VKDLTRQMIGDYRYFLKESHWEDHERSIKEEAETYGPYINILDIYSDDDRTELLERIYQKEHNIGTPYGYSLDCRRAGVDNLNILLETDENKKALFLEFMSKYYEWLNEDTSEEYDTPMSELGLKPNAPKKATEAYSVVCDVCKTPAKRTVIEVAIPESASKRAAG